MVNDNQATAAETGMTRKPPFRADHVGSLIRSPKLIEAHTAYLQGKIPAGALHELEDAAISDAVCDAGAGRARPYHRWRAATQ